MADFDGQIDRAWKGGAMAMQPAVTAPGRRVRWQPTAATLKMRVYATLFAIDLVSVFAGFSLAMYLGDQRFATWAIVAPTLLVVYAATALYSRSYSSDSVAGPLRAAAKGAKALILSLLLVLLIAYALKASQETSRLVMATGGAISFGLIVVSRYVFVRHMVALVGGNPFGVLLLHDGRTPVPPGDFSAVVVMDDGFNPGSDDPVMYDRLAKTVASADRVIVACAPERRAAWAHALKGTNVDGEVFVPELASLAPLGVSAYGDTPTAVVAAGPLDLSDRFVKRAFDIAVAGGALLVIGPVLALVALAIKWDSPGPVLFRQVRIGRGNEMFRILKFRSMRVEQADGEGARSASRDDDRITRVGRLLRRTSIDELPQLLNVLRGDMSIVGPRPHALGSRAQEKLFWEVDGRYWHRHAAKPGLTGLAQVRGYRGATLIEDDLRNRLQADLEYLEHWSIWSDLHIILLTFRVLLHRNAF